MVAAIECQQTVDVCVCKLFVTMGESRRISMEFYAKEPHIFACVVDLDPTSNRSFTLFQIIEIAVRLNIWNLFVSF